MIWCTYITSCPFTSPLCRTTQQLTAEWVESSVTKWLNSWECSWRKGHQQKNGQAADHSRLHRFVDEPGELPGEDHPRRQWTTLNRLRTGVGRFAVTMKGWGLKDSAACDCGHPEQNRGPHNRVLPATPATQWRIWHPYPGRWHEDMACFHRAAGQTKRRLWAYERRRRLAQVCWWPFRHEHLSWIVGRAWRYG